MRRRKFFLKMEVTSDEKKVRAIRSAKTWSKFFDIWPLSANIIMLDFGTFRIF